METLRGFPFLPALWLRRAKPGFANASDMETLRGFPFLPALWLRRAKPGFVNASDMETLRGLALHSAPATRPATPSLRSASPFPRHLPPSLPPPRCARPRALWLRRAKPGFANASKGWRVRCGLIWLERYVAAARPVKEPGGKSHALQFTTCACGRGQNTEQVENDMIS